MKKLDRRGFLKQSATWSVLPIAAKFLKLEIPERESEPEQKPADMDEVDIQYGYHPYEWDGRTFEVAGTLSGYTIPVSVRDYWSQGRGRSIQFGEDE